MVEVEVPNPQPSVPHEAGVRRTRDVRPVALKQPLKRTVPPAGQVAHEALVGDRKAPTPLLALEEGAVPVLRNTARLDLDARPPAPFVPRPRSFPVPVQGAAQVSTRAAVVRQAWHLRRPRLLLGRIRRPDGADRAIRSPRVGVPTVRLSPGAKAAGPFLPSVIPYVLPLS